MSTANFQVRRATIDDLPKLIPLWQREDLPWQALEKRFKEFQVVESPEGELVGGVGLEIAGAEGHLHNEMFAHAEQADTLRELLWERAMVLAKNHGLVRLWHQFTTPFWSRGNFQYAPPELLSKVPSSFGANTQPWKFLQLRDDVSPTQFVEREFAAFREIEKQRTARLYQQAKFLKLLAAILVLGVFVLCVFWMVAWFRARGQLAH